MCPSTLSGVEREGVFAGGCAQQSDNQNNHKQTHKQKELDQNDTLVYLNNNSNNNNKVNDNIGGENNIINNNNKNNNNNFNIKNEKTEELLIKTGNVFGPYKGRMMGVSEMRSVDDNRYMWEVGG